MNRTREQWDAVCPRAVAETASPAAVMYLIQDALSDIARLHRQADQLRAEVEALRKDAERWRKAREILPVESIKIAHSDFVNFGLPPDEKENVRVDDAIDAAMAAKEVE